MIFISIQFAESKLKLIAFRFSILNPKAFAFELNLHGFVAYIANFGSGSQFVIKITLLWG